MALLCSRSRLAAGVLILLAIISVFLALGQTQWFSKQPQWDAFSRTDSGWEERGRIPSKIWQIFYGYSDLNPQLRKGTDSWLNKNPAWSYSRLGKQGANDFVQHHYSDRQDLVQLYSSIKTPVLAADLLRYMILATEGGVYSDIDTVALQPVEQWVPAGLISNVSAIIGIEYDRRKDRSRLPAFAHDLQFCQWTVAAAKNHSMLGMAVEKVANAIHDLSFRKGVAIEDLKPTDWEVLTTTGPGIWTEVVFDSLSVASGREILKKDLTEMREPVLFGDILVLPISGFAIGVPHSGGRNIDPRKAFVRHDFKGSWRHHWWQWWE